MAKSELVGKYVTTADIKRLCGVGPEFTVDTRPGVGFDREHAPAYHTTPSGKTIVHSPGAYRYPTWYHHAVNKLTIGQAVVDALDLILEHAPAHATERSGAALDNEVAVRVGRGRAVRYMLDHCGRLVRMGIAVRMPADLKARFGRWEHGRDTEACDREIANKRAALLLDAREKVQTARDLRKARLLARLSAAPVYYSDARLAGYCDAGIRSWAEARGLDVTASVPLATLAKDTDRQAQALALRVARRLLAVAA